MKQMQCFVALVIIGIGVLSGCRLTGYAEEEKQLAEDLCLQSSEDGRRLLLPL